MLFEAMVAAGLPKQVGPIGVMLSEHEQGRAFTQGMRAAAERQASGDASAAPVVVANARGYAMLLRQHIQKEDGILFPMADEVISAGRHAAVLAGFAHVEHEETGEGVHEKYLALAEALDPMLDPKARPDRRWSGLASGVTDSSHDRSTQQQQA